MTVSGEIVTSDPDPAPDSSINEIQGEDKPLLSSSPTPALSKPRALLPEYIKFKGFTFEVQIVYKLCTSLRHTWNEIEQKRKYKAGTELPDNLNRDINELSVFIDRTDKELNDYSRDVDRLIKSGTTDQELKRPLYSSDLGRFLNKTLREVPGFEPSIGKRGSNDILNEIKSMGLKTISDFKKIIPPDLKQAYRKVSKPMID